MVNRITKRLVQAILLLKLIYNMSAAPFGTLEDDEVHQKVWGKHIYILEEMPDQSLR